MKLINYSLLSLGLIVAAGACSKKDKDNDNDNEADKSADKAPASNATDPKPATPAPAEVKEKAAPAPKLADYDLSPAGKKWKGWMATGPEGCKAMGDMGKAARLACNGPGLGDKSGRNGFDIIFGHGHKDLAKFKESKKERWTAAEAKGEHTILADEPGFLAWKLGSKYTSFHFLKHVTVGEDKFTCSTNLMIGAGVEDEHKQHLAGCETLKKSQ